MARGPQTIETARRFFFFFFNVRKYNNYFIHYSLFLCYLSLLHVKKIKGGEREREIFHNPIILNVNRHHKMRNSTPITLIIKIREGKLVSTGTL